MAPKVMKFEKTCNTLHQSMHIRKLQRQKHKNRVKYGTMSEVWHDFLGVTPFWRKPMPPFLGFLTDNFILDMIGIS